MTALPNPFLNSGTPPSPAVPDTAGVAPQPPVAPAGTISVSPGVGMSSLPSGESEPSVMPASTPGENRYPLSDGVPRWWLGVAPSETEGAVSVSTASFDNTDHIHEIFAGAQRLPRRALPDDFQAFIDEIEREREALWADEPPLFLQRQA